MCVAKSSWNTCVSVQVYRARLKRRNLQWVWLTASLYGKSSNSSQSSSSDMYSLSDIGTKKEGFFRSHFLRDFVGYKGPNAVGR